MNPILSLIIANIIWGMAAPIFKYSLTNIPPFTLAFLRFFLASLLFLPFIQMHTIKTISRSDWIKLTIGALTGITLNISFFFLGLLKSESINAPIIASSGPLFLFILAVIFLHEKPKLRVIGGMLLSFLGVLIIVISPILMNGGIKDIGKVEGNILYIAATASSVIMPIILKDLFKRINPYMIAFLTFLIASSTFLPFMINEFNNWSFADLRLPGIIGILFGVLFSSGLAYYLYYYGLGKIPAQEIGVFTYIDPVIAVIIAIPLLGEYPDIFFFLGSAFVFGGIYISERRIHYHPIHKIKNFK